MGGMRSEEIVLANTSINARKLMKAKYGDAITIISVTRA